MKSIIFTEGESGARDLYYNDVQSETIREIERVVGDKEFERIINMETKKVMQLIDEVLDSNKLSI